MNGEGGNLKGLELSVALTGELFTDALSGFGALLSVSKTESSITIQDPPNNQFTGGNGLGTDPAAGPVEDSLECDGVLRERRFLGARRDSLAFGIHR